MTQKGDVLIVEEDEDLEIDEKRDVADESDSDSDGSLSTDTDEHDLPAIEDHGDGHNLAAPKPIKMVGKRVDIDDDKHVKAPVQRKKIKLTRKERSKSRKTGRAKLMIAMAQPNLIADRERERKLVHMATKGVVQLFNRVSEKQVEIKKREEAEKKANETKPLIKKKDPEGGARPPLSRRLNIQVPFGPPSKKPKKDDIDDDEIKTDGEDVQVIDTDTDGVQILSEAEVKTEAESDSD